MKKVSIITVNYNHSEVTEALLKSFYLKNNYKNIEIIVVDNASVDNPINKWINIFPNVTFLRSEENLGFAGGNNLGIAQSSGDYLFLVNNDTEFTEDLVEKLVATLDSNTKIGMVSPKIRYFDNPDILQYVGFTPMNYYTARNKCIGQFEKDAGQYDHLNGKTGFVHGAAMMIRKEAITKAGLMAENFFLYYEEMDWCDRVRKAGFEIWVNTSAIIYHKESISVGKNSQLKEYYMNRNRILYIRRNANVFCRLVFYVHFSFLVVPRNIINYLKNGDKGFVSQLLRAIRWNIINSRDSNYLGFKA